MTSTSQLSARDRIVTLLDENSFVEVGALVTRRSTDFNLQQKEVPSDGVITGYGIIDGNPVYIYSQDVTAMNGSIGEMHAKKISNLYDLAMKVGAPVIGLIDCAGLRLQEATDALAGFGDIYLKQTLASGVIPQITAIFGTCGGGSAVSASLSDFVFMEEKNAKLFVNAPNAILGNNSTKCDTATASFMAESGVVDFVEADEVSVLNSIRNLVVMLPSNNEDDASYEECTDDLNRALTSFTSKLSDTTFALKDLSDHGIFVEVKKAYAMDMVTGFIKLNGATVGAIANRNALLDEDGNVLEKYDESLSTAGCYKAEKFIKFCDAFQIPVLTLTNVSGYSATMNDASTIAIAAAKLTYAFANATVPKVNVILEKAYGSAYITMNSKHIGADMVFALEGSIIGTMEAELAAQIMYEDNKEIQAEKAKEYKESQQSTESAAKRGYVDAIITPESVRQHVIYAFEILFTKRESRPSKKHGTV
ncbi:acyl-CoA carboxylase subunit beta [Lachnoclostridium phytofermentans]|uniref:acyl-CoA carboxylase subunit beta n=1 Tax=Lachnoclostridium phytofermentans TaxID=66219 RepID=UPI000496CD5D|nr:carboxyl transferase domain-containing protein [Lachnoclostridium phytofermentans]